MELNDNDREILNFIKEQNCKVENSLLQAEFGKDCSVSVKRLHQRHYIKSPDLIAEGMYGFETEDNWEITAEGLDYLDNYDEEKKSKLKELVVGAIIGVLTTLIGGLALNWIWNKFN